MSERGLTRRTFLMGSALTVAGLPTVAGAAGRRGSPTEKLNVAAIGAGGMGASDVRGMSRENLIALCDVDWDRAAESFNRFPNARRYKDFRVMLDKEPLLDAVTVSTPDHTHTVAALEAMRRGIHVRVQKPLTWSIAEARALREAAHKYKVVTAMGNQGHAGDGVRQMCEILWSNAIGPVREAHIWTNRPVWDQTPRQKLPSQAVPEQMDWDLWLGPAPYRHYNRGYAPWDWRGWWEFGCGALGDMACHIMDPANWALQLVTPTSVECVSMEGGSEETPPMKSIIKYEFPARPFREKVEVAWSGKTLPPVTVYWYDGGLMPPQPPGVPEGTRLGDGDNGSYFVGDDGVATTGCYGGGTRLLPEQRMKDFTMPDEVIPRVPEGNSYVEYAMACKGGPLPGSNFDYSVPFTEVVHLGSLAVRAGVGVKIHWDAKAMRSPNVPRVNLFVGRQHPRRGWEITV
jgi:predicted dehydrogenase